MDYLDLIINLVCFSLLFAFFPSGLLSQHQHAEPRQVHRLHPTYSPIPSPRSPAFNTSFEQLGVPTITLTPDRPNPQRHKRKSVSFSISSMDDIARDNGEAHKRRPPTPYVSGQVSPWASSPLPSAPGSPLARNVEVVDPMGVQKQWLMA